MPYRRKLPPLDPCPVELVIGMVGGKWKARILCSLAMRPMTYSELKEEFSQTPQPVLSAQLKALCRDLLLDRDESKVGDQTRVSYSISPKGQTLIPVLEAVEAWGIRELLELGIEWSRKSSTNGEV
jgi:DNA-binding HxlR family transcriptional regulator